MGRKLHGVINNLQQWGKVISKRGISYYLTTNKKLLNLNCIEINFIVTKFIYITVAIYTHGGMKLLGAYNLSQNNDNYTKLYETRWQILDQLTSNFRKRLLISAYVTNKTN